MANTTAKTKTGIQQTGWRERLYAFFEEPTSTFARLTGILLVSLIFVSVGMVIIEIEYTEFFFEYHRTFWWVELVITGAFTIEYVLRFISSPHGWRFPFRIFNIVDLLAILPFFLGIDNSGAARALRILRVFKLFRYISIFGAFKYKNTILQRVMPVIIIFTLFKTAMLWFEHRGIWNPSPDFIELLGIVGFALGVIFGQKISVVYQKFLAVDDTLLEIRASLASLSYFLNECQKDLGNKTIKPWLQAFSKSMHTANQYEAHAVMDLAGKTLYDQVKKIEEKPAQLALFTAKLKRDAAFVLGEKSRMAPAAYDNMLQQATLVYITLLCLFVPGVAGVVFVTIATFLLYGMYHVSVDFDNPMGNDGGLIEVETHELGEMLDRLEKYNSVDRVPKGYIHDNT